MGVRGGAFDNCQDWKIDGVAFGIYYQQKFDFWNKNWLYFACVHSVMLYGSKTWPNKED